MTVFMFLSFIYVVLLKWEENDKNASRRRKRIITYNLRNGLRKRFYEAKKQ